VSSDLSSFQPQCGQKSLSFFYRKTRFSTHFWPKTTLKHHMNCDKSYYDLKKPKNYLKTDVNPKPKINLSSNMFFNNPDISKKIFAR
jgi:hypothetical protein